MMDNIREKLVELLRNGRVQHMVCSSDGDPVTSYVTSMVNEDYVSLLADYLIDNGVTVKVKKEKPPVDLTNKCGSCKHSVPAVGVFGDSTCYVRCTNKEHLSGRHYQQHPIAAVRQRTAKACKKYEPRSQPPKGE